MRESVVGSEFGDATFVTFLFGGLGGERQQSDDEDLQRRMKNDVSYGKIFAIIILGVDSEGGVEIVERLRISRDFEILDGCTAMMGQRWRSRLVAPKGCRL